LCSRPPCSHLRQIAIHQDSTKIPHTPRPPSPLLLLNANPKNEHTTSQPHAFWPLRAPTTNNHSAAQWCAPPTSPLLKSVSRPASIRHAPQYQFPCALLLYLDHEADVRINRLQDFFVAPRLQTIPRAGVRHDVAQPIFILGFPRSGTTLVEQTLSAHPRISAGDELPLINDITRIMPRMLNSPLGYPEALAELWMGDQCEGLDNLRDYYLQKVGQMRIVEPGTAWFTDKMPLNETHLGLIALIFPEAPLIHVIRHPLDIMVSAMSNLFTHGLFCASALETAARHYVRVMSLVQHYRAEMTLCYLAIPYEDMVGDQATNVRTMLDFAGEPFDPGCLRFEENHRYARTASYAQVTEKLYDRSRYRYRHYRKHLEPAIPILRPVIERLGYTIE
jgi:Sulfotransferase family